jgi:hypothetical protein
MRIVGGILTFGLVALLAVGCGDSPTSSMPATSNNVTTGSDQPDTTPAAGPEIFRAVLSGSEETPPVATTARGSVSFHLSRDGSAIVYAITVDDMSNITAAHIHIGAPGVSGPVVVTLFEGSVAGPYDGLLAQGVITASMLRGELSGESMTDVLELLASGTTYVNVHTAAHPNGEIRGEIVRSPEGDTGPE